MVSGAPTSLCLCLRGTQRAVGSYSCLILRRVPASDHGCFAIRAKNSHLAVKNLEQDLEVNATEYNVRSTTP